MILPEPRPESNQKSVGWPETGFVQETPLHSVESRTFYMEERENTDKYCAVYRLLKKIMQQNQELLQQQKTHLCNQVIVIFYLFIYLFHLKRS